MASAPPAPVPERIELFCSHVDVVTMAEALARCEAIIRRGGPGQHMALNTAKLVAMQRDERLRDAVNRCELITADGHGIVLAARLLPGRRIERVTGIDLMEELMRLAAERGYGVFLLGAEAAVLEEAVPVLRRRYPSIVVAGTQHGYFSADETPAVCERIRRSGAQLLFVAMTSPKKEYFLQANLPTLGVPFAMGVGGALDILAGRTRRAPRLWQRLWLEWLYRMLQEPRRMVFRYAYSNARFALMLARELAGHLTAR